MAKKMLTIDGITFPKYSKKSSKKNFRLVFFIGFTDNNGERKTTIATKPLEGEWQWRKSGKKRYLTVADDLGDSVELDVSVLRFDDPENGFTSTDYQIAEIDGDISLIAVQFMDVKDSNIFKKFMTGAVEQFKAFGFNPIDLLPVPGIVTGLVKDAIEFDSLVDKLGENISEETKDKVLHRVNKKYDGENPFVISGRKEWKKNKTGTYGVTIGFE